MKKGIICLLIGLISLSQTYAQNWDINTVKEVNGWDMHGLSRGLSHSGIILPVGLPTAMGIYALIRNEESIKSIKHASCKRIGQGRIGGMFY